MNRSRLFFASMILIATPAFAPAIEWPEFSDGSARLPGTLRMQHFIPSLAETGRASIRPRLGLTRQGEPVLAMYSTNILNAQSARNGVYTIGFQGGAWGLYPAGSNGTILAADGLLLRISNGPLPSRFSLATLPEIASTSTNANQLSIAAAMYQPLQPYSDLYAAVAPANAEAWAARGNSLSPGGLTGPASFNNEVFDSATALDNAGNIHVAWTEGAAGARGVYVMRHVLGAWSGLGASDVTPIAAPSAGVNHRHPSIGFSAGNPIVAWGERTGTLERIKVLRFNVANGQWAGLGNSASEGIGFGRFPQVAHFEDRAPFFVAFETPGLGTLTVMQHQGNQWTNMGNPVAPWGLAGVATFTESTVGNTNQPSVPSFSLALDRRGDPVVAFRAESPAGSNRYHIFASVYLRESGTWAALGNTGDPLGVSNFVYTPVQPAEVGRGFGHYAPSLTIRRDNVALLAWEFDDGSASAPVVFMRRTSEPVVRLPSSSAEVLAHLLGTAPSLNPSMDDNADGIIDAADLERFISRGQ